MDSTLAGRQSLFPFLFLLFILSGCANSDMVNGGDSSKNNIQNSSPQWTLWNTYYYVSNESDHPSSETTGIYTSSCEKIADVSIRYSDLACIEGTGQLNDGRLINYASTCRCGRPCPTGGTVCWSVLDTTQFPWGKGARNNPLHPLRSLAVDRSIIPLGRTIYIPSWDGMIIPALSGLAGFEHDGCFRTDDVGGAIQGTHIDIFSGTSEMRRYLETQIPTQTQMPAYWGTGRCDYLLSLAPPPYRTPSTSSTSPPSPPPTPQGAWLGESCQSDQACAQTGEAQGSWCQFPLDQQVWGFCTQSCAGFCPDRQGSASTFCIDGQFQGIQGGICVAQSQPENGYCTQLDGLDAQVQDRYVGQSGASNISQMVCIPNPVSSPPPGSMSDFGPPPSSLDQGVPSYFDYSFDPPELDQGFGQAVDQALPNPPSSNQGVCSNPTLILSDHNDPCPSSLDNQWRCACSRRFETEISQVCREGAWITYDTNPIDCIRCSGDYSSACEPSN